MNLYFFFRGENGKLESIGPYFFEAEALKKLEKDFEDYCQSSNSTTHTKKGGWYNCKSNKQDTTVFLKFNEILCIG